MRRAVDHPRVSRSAGSTDTRVPMIRLTSKPIPAVRTSKPTSAARGSRKGCPAKSVRCSSTRQSRRGRRRRPPAPSLPSSIAESATHGPRQARRGPPLHAAVLRHARSRLDMFAAIEEHEAHGPGQNESCCSTRNTSSSRIGAITTEWPLWCGRSCVQRVISVRRSSRAAASGTPGFSRPTAIRP